jgi:hypothetical protein
MSAPEELKWLYKELWAWRAFGLLIVALFMGIEILKWKDLNRHSNDTQTFQAQSTEKFDRLRGMIDKNWIGLQNVDDDINQVNSNLYECLRCHAHSLSVTKKFEPRKPQ